MRTGIALSLLLILATSLFAQQPDHSAQMVELRSLLRNASSLLPMVDETQQSSVAANIASLQVQAGDVEGALLTTKSLASRGDPGLAIDTVAGVLAREGNQELALKLVDTSSRDNIKASSYLQMSIMLAQKGKFELATETANRIPDDQFPVWVDASMRLYEMEFKAGKIEPAAQLLQSVEERLQKDQLSELPPASRQGLIFTIIRYLAESGNPVAAWPFLEAMRARADNEPDPTQSNYLLRDLAIAEATLGGYESALKTINRLPPGNDRDAGFEVVAMIEAQKGDPDSALEQLPNISQDFLRLTMLREVADAESASGNYAKALMLIEAIPRSGDRAYALAQLAIEQAQHDDPTAGYTTELAWETARENPTQTAPYVIAYISVARGLLGDFSGATVLLPDVTGDSKPWALWNLTNFMVQSGDRDRANALADAQTEAYPRAYALLGIAQGMLRQLQPDQDASIR